MLLPAADRRSEIHFYIARSLPYGVRLALAFTLMLCGLMLQMTPAGKYGIQFLAGGAACLFAGILLLLVKGYQNVVRTVGRLEWRPSGDNEVARILSLDAEQRKWDQSFFDITCGTGVIGFILTAAAVGAAAWFVDKVSHQFARLIVIDAVVMLVPFWVTGVRFILKNDKLIVKIRTLLNVKKAYDRAGGGGSDKFVWQLQVAPASGNDGEVPRDVKAMLIPAGAPEPFLGLQMQVSINSVQGNDYPYFYCVAVARPEMGLLEKPVPIPPRKIVIEPKHQGEVDVLVIRQETTKNSGYHTKDKAANYIFAYALEVARAAAR